MVDQQDDDDEQEGGGSIVPLVVASSLRKSNNLLARVGAFLPQIQQANQHLVNDATITTIDSDLVQVDDDASDSSEGDGDERSGGKNTEDKPRMTTELREQPRHKESLISRSLPPPSRTSIQSDQDVETTVNNDEEAKSTEMFSVISTRRKSDASTFSSETIHGRKRLRRKGPLITELG